MPSYDRLKPFIVVIISSFLCATAFLLPDYFGWLMICYCIPILWYIQKNSIITGSALFGGTLIFWAMHSYAIGHFCLKEWAGYGVVFFIFFICYMSSIRLIIIKAMQHVSNYRMCSFNAFSYIIGEILFWYFVSYHAFFIFGNSTGYCCAHPIIPLIESVFIQQIIVHGGSTTTLILIIMTNWIIVTISRKKKIIALASFLVLFLILNKRVELDTSVSSDCVWIKPPQENYLFDWVAEVNDRLVKLHQPDYDHISTIIMPESAFPFPQADINAVVNTLNQTNVLEDRIFICGYYRKENELNCLNSLFFANKSRIINYYDKKTLFPFTEFRPWDWLSWLDTECKFGKGNQCRQPFESQRNDANFAFFICADIFFDTQLLQRRLEFQDKTIVFISNDSWCDFYYFQNLMARYAWLFALSQFKSIWYVSHTAGYTYDFLYQQALERM